VIVPEGLVGRVVQVRSVASVIQLLNDPASTVGATVQRTRTPGLVEGDAGGAVRFKFMARDGARVAPGDLVVTSGLGNLFPKGLPIGRVVTIEDKGSALFHFAVLVPVVDFDRVEEVLLLTGQTTQDVAGLFSPDG
jgi:rod shape-determining protein MreC